MSKPASHPVAPLPTKNALWGGRFASGPAAIMENINVSIDFDKAMAAEDLQGSLAHAAMLAEQGIIAAADAAAIQQGLATIKGELESGQFVFKREHEDIHMNIEVRLAELIGPAAGRLHTARSRNDQVATSFRLWVRGAFDRLDMGLKALQEALITQAEKNAGTIMPGYTHLQPAQPVTFGHHLLAYVEMLGRDRSRVEDARARMNENPLGSAALAGTVYPINRDSTTAALGFDRPTANSLDAVSDRDFALDYLATASILSIHLSRLAEEIVLWCSDAFRFVKLPDSLTTGSSIMPQKRNPDAAELIRAKAGRVIGALTGLMMVLKGTPLAYNKDNQEDKEPVFDADATLALSLAAMTAMIAELTPRPEVMRAAAERGFPTATDLADWLVKAKGVPFREAHHITGRCVKLAEDKGCLLENLSVAELQSVSPLITDEVYKVLTVEASVAARTSFGGTAPDNVAIAATTARKRFL